MTAFNIRSDGFRDSVRNIQRRAEKQELEEKLSASFVPTRVLDELQTDQNQLVFGRRGVGKTHTLKVYLANKVQEGNLCSYVDCTSFGSGFGSEGPSKSIATRFFSKYLNTLVNNLLDHVSYMENTTTTITDRLVQILEQLSEVSTPQSAGETFAYDEMIRLIGLFVSEIGTPRLYLIVDEWAQIPIAAQPYFAEFMKRSLFAAKKTTVKVGVVDYTYRLNDHVDGNAIGLEKSADIFTDVRMDRHFVWDENPTFVEDFFAELLYNHLALQLNASLSIADQQKVKLIRSHLFTQDRAFSELCRASEGNARDFLVIFGRAYADFRRQATRERIGLPDVQRASVAWYREDKVSNISSEDSLERFLQYLIDDVISKKKARAFMVPSPAIHHPLLRRLFAGRVLHPLNVEWSHPDKPGERYSLVSVDYGTYASFKGTRNEPQETLFWDLDENGSSADLPEDLVPIKNDRRSIRRIVVTQEVLDRYWRSARNETGA